MRYCDRCGRAFEGDGACPFCGGAARRLPRCKRCRQPIYPGENAYDGMCPDCFQARVLRMLKEDPKEVADALGALVEAV